ncbi:X-ray radiation resistance-associated protein 1 isoform 15 [Daubentonia madagascariensis]
MLDDNKLSNPNCFANLAGLRRLKKLSLDQNKIFRIPYLQQVQLRNGSGDWVGGRGSPQKEPHSMLQPKSWMIEASDEQPDYTVLPMKKDVDRTEVVFSSYPGFSTSEVTTQVPKVPKQPLLLHHPRVTTIKSPSREMLEPEEGQAEELSTAKSTSLGPKIPTEGLEGLSLPHRTFVPLPPICSDSTVHSEETVSRPSDTAVHLSPEQPSDEDTKSTESIFLTQVSELPSSIIHRDDLQVKEKDQRRPLTAPREVKRTRRKLPSASLPRKYHGYEELLTAKPDPAFTEPKGIQKNAQALQHMLKHPLLYHPSKPKLDTLQKHYVPKEKWAPSCAGGPSSGW